MNDSIKNRLFFENAKLLANAFEITPLMYGSLGLEHLTGENLSADDIDILIPGVFLTRRWNEFQAMLESRGYLLIDEKEHTFEKCGISFSYASVEELESFAGIKPSEINVFQAEDCCYMLLSLEQYLRVYVASSKDGYRATVRNKKDTEKISFICDKLKTPPNNPS